MASESRQSPSPAPAYRRNPNGHQIEQIAETSPISPGHSGRSTPSHSQHAQTSPTTQGLPMELPGSVPPGAHGMRRPLPMDNAAPVPDRSPPGQDARMRNLPGPMQTPGPIGEGAFGRPPKGPPRNDHVSGTPSPQLPRDNSNRSYSPAPPRNFAQGPEQRFSPGPERHNAPAMERQRTPAPYPLSRPEPLPPSSSNGPSSPPQSPITNNSGFDFISGYSRPQGNQSPPGQSPTTAAYPGQRVYQPGRQFS
ncbi:hypothetical protein E4U53_005076 [Claviceps sorghi]|nr:hypothetical protein E4U53_005076 [Claviceps sorghi]